MKRTPPFWARTGLIVLLTTGLGPSAPALDDLLAEARRRARAVERLEGYQFGQSRAEWEALEARLRSPLKREREEAEMWLIVILRSADSTDDARVLACRGLRWVARSGMDSSMTAGTGVETLISFIRHPRLSGEACRALQGTPAPAINPALRDALPLVENTLKIPIILTLGRRGDLEAVQVITDLARDLEIEVIRSAAREALAQIGGRESIQALKEVPFGDGEAAAQRQQHALLRAATRSLSLSPSDREAGLVTLRQLETKSPVESVRLAALYERARAEENERVPLCRRALAAGEKEGLLEIAASLIDLLSQEQVGELYGTFFDSLGAPAQTFLVERWRPEYGSPDRIRALSVSLDSDEALRRAARRTVGRLSQLEASAASPAEDP